MKCAWQAFISLLPQWMRREVDEQGREDLQELRLRTGLLPELLFQNKVSRLSRAAEADDIAFAINAASEYSPWTAQSVGQGYLTAPGGHRVGICGVATVASGKMTGIRTPSSLCMRVARDFEGIARKMADISGSILIIGPPGSGKTTLLRDLIRCKSSCARGCVCVIDEREELFPLYKGQACFSAGERTDILSGCPKPAGIEAVLRTMNPEWIAVDEITAEADCEALRHAGWCGVDLLATAHAASAADLRTRPVYRTLINAQLFPTVIVLKKDKSWSIERIYA